LNLGQIVAGKVLAAAASQSPGGFWMPVEGSTGAVAVDRLFSLIFWVSVFFFVLIVALMVLFVVRYRRRADRMESEATPSHNTALELTWTLIPIAIVIVIFIWGFKVFLSTSTPPANAYQVTVTGQKWKWLFTYPNGHVDENLHVPVDTPIELVMTSEDVIHGFYVPAFRIKRDVLPGRYSKVWFKAVKAGEYQIYCTQYCGAGHSDMWAKVVVHPPGEFARWLENASNFMKTMPPAQAGEQLYRTRGCAQCHTVDGSGATGPTWKGLFGSHVSIEGGRSMVADEDYIRTCILDPTKNIPVGYQPVMPTFKGRLSDDEITAIIAYIKSLK
jgi:cytochrome c oxidase subunit II